MPTEGPEVKNWVVAISGHQGRRKYLNIVDVVDTENEAKAIAKNVRNHPDYEEAKRSYDVVIHVRPNYKGK